MRPSRGWRGAGADERIREIEWKDPAVEREADHVHDRNRDEKDEALRAAPEPQMTGARNRPGGETQEHQGARLRSFDGTGAHEALVYHPDRPRNGHAERDSSERANPVRGRHPRRPLEHQRGSGWDKRQEENDSCAGVATGHQPAVANLPAEACGANQSRDRCAEVDPRTPRAHRQRGAPEVKRARRQLMTDEMTDGIRRDRQPIDERGGVRPARRERGEPEYSTAQVTEPIKERAPQHDCKDKR